MFFTILCPSCSKSLKVRDELVGRSARCPYCRHAITVQRPETAETTLPSVVSSSNPESRARKREAAVPVPGAQGFVGKAPRTPVSSSAFSVTADTDVGVLKHLLVGVLGTAAFYALLWPIAWSDGKQTYLGRLFIGTSTMAQGGWVPVAELFLFFWAIGMLVEKWLKIRRQKRGLLYDVLPMEYGDSITLENLDRFVSHIRGLPPDAVGSFLVTRCLRGLEHFRVRKSAPDTATMLSSQSDIDAGSVDSSYTMFHVFIWAIPILGFLGTVIGVSAAVGSFTGTLDGSSDISVMKNALRGITGGLATAFDTTLVALSMAMILTFPVSALQKNEGDLLGQVDEYTISAGSTMVVPAGPSEGSVAIAVRCSA
ncbi:MAG: MotA/TolQ/ExbB proton channel family protein [Planctomycetia bacterium]|nr:MotA/TolQ/ExbB proton channel family protein [Planctomycetia bacterium]